MEALFGALCKVVVFMAILWSNFRGEMKMLDLCSNCNDKAHVMAVQCCHQTVCRFLIFGPTNILHQYFLNPN